MPYSRNKLVYFAMEYGLLLSAYFAVKFFVSTLMLHSPMVFLVMAWILVIGIPIVIYWFMRLYRDRHCGGFISYGQAWVLGFYLVCFASLPEALVEYVYCQYISPDYIFNQITQMKTMLAAIPELKDSVQGQQLLEAYEAAATPTPIQAAFQGIYNNMVLGAITSVVLAAMVRRSKPASK